MHVCNLYIRVYAILCVCVYMRVRKKSGVHQSLKHPPQYARAQPMRGCMSKSAADFTAAVMAGAGGG